MLGRDPPWGFVYKRGWTERRRRGKKRGAGREGGQQRLEAEQSPGVEGGEDVAKLQLFTDSSQGNQASFSLLEQQQQQRQ